MNSPTKYPLSSARVAPGIVLVAVMTLAVGALSGCGGAQREAEQSVAAAESERFPETTPEYRARVILDELTQVIELNTNPSDELEQRVRAFISANRTSMQAVEQEIMAAAEGRSYSERIAYEDAIAGFMNDAMQRYEDALSEVERRDEDLERRIRSLVERATR